MAAKLRSMKKAVESQDTTIHCNETIIREKTNLFNINNVLDSFGKPVGRLDTARTEEKWSRVEGVQRSSQRRDLVRLRAVNYNGRRRNELNKPVDVRIAVLIEERVDRLYMPLYVRFEGKRCLVVGGGKVAFRKVEALLGSGAVVTVVSPRATRSLAEAAKRDALQWWKRTFRESDMEGMWFVVAATSNRVENERVFRLAEDEKILCNVVDQPDLCSAIFPAVVERGDLQIAVSTSGTSPAMAAVIRRELDDQFGEEYALALEILAKLRTWARYSAVPAVKRQAGFRNLAGREFLKRCRDRDGVGIEKMIQQAFGQPIELKRLGFSALGGDGD
jgi:precorrin-2 dehydrogenase / sirohydrochlorin ferrochelatase